MSIRLHQVSYQHPGAHGRVLLDIPKWQIETGSQVFLQGASGCGKSTLLNLLSGICLPQTGQIKLLGQSINHLGSRKRDKFRSRHIGYISQQFNLIPYLNALENIQLGANLSGCKPVPTERIQQLLDKLKLEPVHWQTPARNLSIGQQQRVAIVRAMAHQPEIILADEPTSALDPDNSQRFIDTLLSLCQDTRATLLFVSHDQHLANQFDESLHLSDINQAGA